MVVEDAKDLAMLYERSLAGLGLNILKVESGRKALEILKLQKPHLMILDLSLKDISTVDFYEQLSLIPDVSQIPKILISGRDDLESWAQIFGARLALRKPIEQKKIHEAVKGFLPQLS